MFEGFQERDREHRLWQAVVACSLGGGDPHRMIGESSPDDGGGWEEAGFDVSQFFRAQLKDGLESQRRWLVDLGLERDDDPDGEVFE